MNAATLLSFRRSERSERPDDAVAKPLSSEHRQDASGLFALSALG
jgi:hypothetical protein